MFRLKADQNPGVPPMEPAHPIGTSGLTGPSFFASSQSASGATAKEVKPFVLKASSRQDIISALKQFPASDLYRFLIDGRLHRAENGWLEYALREHGSLPGVLDAFKYVLGHDLADPCISADLLKNIHSRVTTPVSIRGYSKNPMSSGEFRDDITTFQPIPEADRAGYCNEEGLYALKDFVQRHLHQGSVLFIGIRSTMDVMRECHQGKYNTQKELDDAFLAVKEYIKCAPDESVKATYQRLCLGEPWKFRAPAPEYIDALIENTCNQYNSAIITASTSEDKLRVIVSSVQEIERIHPFCDGNGRTSYILLQRLLIQNGFLPSMMFNPNHLDGHSTESVIEELMEGMRLTQALIDNPEMPVFDYKTPKKRLTFDDSDDIPPMAIYSDPELITSVKAVIDNYYVAAQDLSEFIQGIQNEEKLGITV